jgi:3-oxoacyl-[acyl-carrier protein] reductase
LDTRIDLRTDQAETRLAADSAAPRFAGKVALITGASDKGIGGAIARRLTKEGAAVSLVSRHEPKQLLRRLGKSHAGSFVFTTCDVRDAGDVRHAIDATMEEFGQIDVLVNNAGIDECGPLESFSDEEWLRVLDVNLTGAMRLTRAALSFLPEPGGVVVNIASALALGGCQNFTAYSASKAGLIGFTQSLAAELAPKRQRAVAIAPALVLTPMVRRYVGELTETTWARVEQCHPLGIGLPEDVAAAVAFLASEDARWITGISLPMGWMPTFSLPADLFNGS